ncbi:MAG: potassium-transporting ATPase subunit KdpA [Polyangiaceae bacterium]
MSARDAIVLAVFVLTLGLLAWPLGLFVARVTDGGVPFLAPILRPVERLFQRLVGITDDHEQDVRAYGTSLLLFNLVGCVAVYAIQRLQHVLPFDPNGRAAPNPHSAFDTAMSFVTNTNWQGYAGESTLSYFTQMVALGVQNFVSAATGLAVLLALARGFARTESSTLGSFWNDLVRSTVYVLLPTSFVLALVLVSQGVVQTFAADAHATLVEPFRTDGGRIVLEQTIPLGPVASQVAIKQLGTNGGGFFNANSAHPFENPTAISNFVELLAILLLPAALCHAFGKIVKDARQGWALFAAMLVLFVPFAVAASWFEHHPSPALASLGLDVASTLDAPGGNMEGKEVRFGIDGSTLWATATTAASNGSVNSMHDSFTPLGGLVPLVLIQLGEVVFGGVGSGLYGMIVFALVAVFVAGLMVGRTPEYLGKKVEAFEMKMASLVILVPAFTVLVGTAIGVSTTLGKSAVGNPGPHGFSEILYAFSSAANNNGSAFGGLSAGSTFYDVALGFAMFVGRFGVLVPVLGLAGGLAAKKRTPASSGTLPTHGPLFVSLLVGIVLLVGALTYVPALALGPVVEHVGAMRRPS